MTLWGNPESNQRFLLFNDKPDSWENRNGDASTHIFQNIKLLSMTSKYITTQEEITGITIVIRELLNQKAMSTKFLHKNSKIQ
jgi:hypothetical protein